MLLSQYVVATSLNPPVIDFTVQPPLFHAHHHFGLPKMADIIPWCRSPLSLTNRAFEEQPELHNADTGLVVEHTASWEYVQRHDALLLQR